MQTIHKKIWPKYFERIQNGEKNMEARLADFECEPGDTIIFEEWDPETKEYTGRTISKTIKVAIRTKGAEEWGMYTEEELNEHGLIFFSF